MSAILSLAAPLVRLGSFLALGAVISNGNVLAHGSPVVRESGAPTVQLTNGSYNGVYSSSYDQDFFLGVPYAQPPTGNLRFRAPQSINTTWSEAKDATEYSPECIGYGSDTWVLGNVVSEDCLTLNIVRPAGLSNDANLPVAFWIHGGGFTEGGNADPRYNLSFIVQQSVEMGSPIVAVGINYRLQAWGWLYSQEIKDAGATNLGLRDQRLALHWVQENIGAFGGDKTKVTIWGESAGAHSVGCHLVAYGGRDEGLFRGAISESGGPTGLSRYQNVSYYQPYYDAVVNATNCTGSTDTLTCLRQVPVGALSAIFNSSIISNVTLYPVVDNDIIRASTTTETKNGHFVKVPYLTGANQAEGGSFGTKGINTTEEFLSMVLSYGVDNATADILAAVYPDIPEIGVPATLHSRPPVSDVGTYGYQWKRSAAYGGDVLFHAGRRITNEMWAAYNVSSWAYHFNVLVNGGNYLTGATHFQEVAFVFHNIDGLGYNTSFTVDPYANEPETYPQLATVMSRMWISFVTDLDPNYSGATNVHWPVYTSDNRNVVVFDTNVTALAYVEEDTYRAEGIAFIGDHLDTSFGR